MKKYYVTIEYEYGGVIEEDYMLKTDDEDEAIKEARYFASRTSGKVEIRMYKEDIDDENCDCFDYDTLDFQQEEEPDRIPDRIVDIESFAADLCDRGWRAEDRDELIEDYNLSPDDADAICEKLAEYDELERVTDIAGSAADLYDGGWRADDRDQMIKEYNLRPDDADAICEKLAEYEENENE